MLWGNEVEEDADDSSHWNDTTQESSLGGGLEGSMVKALSTNALVGEGSGSTVVTPQLLVSAEEMDEGAQGSAAAAESQNKSPLNSHEFPPSLSISRNGIMPSESDPPLETSRSRTNSEAGFASQVMARGCLGVLKLKVISARVFDSPISGTHVANDLDKISGKDGDYYIRISSNRPLIDPLRMPSSAGSASNVTLTLPPETPLPYEGALGGTNESPQRSGEIFRTHVDYATSTPNFDSDFRFVISDYGQVFKMDLVDSSDDRVLGVHVVGVQELLQYQRDAYVAGNSGDSLKLFTSALKTLLSPPSYNLGEKNDDEFGAAASSGGGLTSDSGSATKQGQLRRREFLRTANTSAAYKNKDIYSVGYLSKCFTHHHKSSGFVDFAACVSENPETIYNLATTQAIESRPEEEFNVDLTKLHVFRLQKILGTAERWLSNYQHLMSWNDWKLSFFCMVGFTCCCIFINMEYVGCLPFSALMLNMVIKYRRRSTGQFVERYINADSLKLRKKAEKSRGEVHR